MHPTTTSMAAESHSPPIKWARLLVLMLSVALAGAMTLVATPASAATAGKVTGKVTSTSGRPIANIEVSAYYYDWDGEYWIEEQDTKTAADGSYVLNLMPGQNVIEFNDPSGKWAYTCWGPCSNDPDLSTWINVYSGQTTSGVSVQMSLTLEALPACLDARSQQSAASLAVNNAAAQVRNAQGALAQANAKFARIKKSKKKKRKARAVVAARAAQVASAQASLNAAAAAKARADALEVAKC